MTGPSRPLDPRTDAARSDIADIRIADRVFASHYAAPLQRPVATQATLRSARSTSSPVVAELSPGDVFEVLEVTGGVAWGIAVGCGLVGYLDAAAVSA